MTDRQSLQSKSGSLLAVASDKGYVSVFDTESGTLVSSFPGASRSSWETSYTR